MRILVTGGAGFVGSHLCQALVEKGHEVTALDNLITGSRLNIQHLLSHPGFRFIEHDVTQPFTDGGWEAIFHLASPASPVSYDKYPVETMLANSIGTYNLLELALRSQAKFLLASTSEVYGDPKVHPQPETYWGNVNPVGPRAHYDEAKRFAEALTMIYVQRRGLDGRIVRIFNTYGPRSDPQDGRIIPNFITQALQGEPVTVYGDGSQTRSFCYVSDLVEGITRALFTEKTCGQIINLGNPDERSALEIAKIIKRLAGSPSPIIHIPSRKEEIARRQPDITRAQQILGWQPKVGLEEGLKETVAWFRERSAQGQ